MKKTIKLFSLALAATMVFTLGACSSSSEPSSSTSASTSTSSEAPSETPIKVGLVISANFGTQSFVDVILAGCEQAQDELGVELLKVENIKVPQLADTYRTLIGQGVNLIIGAEASQADVIATLAPEFPDVMFASVDAEVPGNLSNVVSYSYKEHESAFLLGAFTALMTENDKVAFIGGTEGGTMVRFQAGFESGAQYINPDIDVAVAYVGWADTTKGKETATMLYNQGYDWIAPCAGGSNLGVFQAAEELGGDNWVCGAADGQFHLMPSRIVASQVKRVDTVAYTAIKSAVDGTFVGGESIVMGLAEDGVDMPYTNMNDDLLAMIPAEVTTQIEELRNSIISGDIVVPGTFEEAEAFLN